MNKISNYNFVIKYRRGKENIDADYLPRRPMDIGELFLVERPNKEDWKELSWISKVLMKSLTKLLLADGIPMRKTEGYTEIVLPAEYHQMVLEQLHERIWDMNEP